MAACLPPVLSLLTAIRLSLPKNPGMTSEVIDQEENDSSDKRPSISVRSRGSFLIGVLSRMMKSVNFTMVSGPFRILFDSNPFRFESLSNSCCSSSSQLNAGKPKTFLEKKRTKNFWRTSTTFEQKNSLNIFEATFSRQENLFLICSNCYRFLTCWRC